MAIQAPTISTHKRTMLPMAKNMLQWYPTAMKRLYLISLFAASMLMAADVTGHGISRLIDTGRGLNEEEVNSVKFQIDAQSVSFALLA